MYKVFIIDDHQSICEGLELVLTQSGEFSVVGAIPGAAEADIFCGRLKPDLVFMDVCTEEGASGLDAVKKIRELYPNIKIIVMSGFDEMSYMPRARELGASAFIFKSKSLTFFAEIARKVMQGGFYWPEPKTIPVPTGEAELTEREIEVLRLVCMGMSNDGIAEELTIEESTVKKHKSNILAKMGFAKMIDLTAYVIENGWIRPTY